jgi:hypothetical protein
MSPAFEMSFLQNCFSSLIAKAKTILLMVDQVDMGVVLL